jgi:hypothetical protein
MEIEKVEQFVRAHANPDFRYEKNEEAPFVRLTKKVFEAKGVVISTGGIFVKGHQPFNDNFGIGDPSYREIPSDMAASMLDYHSTRSGQEINSRKCGLRYTGSGVTGLPTDGQFGRTGIGGKRDRYCNSFPDAGCCRESKSSSHCLV